LNNLTAIANIKEEEQPKDNKTEEEHIYYVLIPRAALPESIDLS
jgi:hypothetical protein